MKNSANHGWLEILVILICTATALAAPTKGVPPFQSFGGGPDIINLGNLNMHYSFPVFSRAGRGIPFSYALAYESSVWAPAGSAWTFTSSGLVADIAAAVGTTTVTLQQANCTDPYNGQRYYYNIYKFQNYWDSAGTLHPFAQVAVNDNDGTCGATPKPTATIAITDGSGITLNVSDGPAASATLRSGEVIQVPVSISGAASGPTSQKDANGNQITSSTTSGVTNFYDTLSSTTRVLSISGTAPSPVSYTYTAPSGASAAVVVSYVSYSVQTNFGCSGINEYGPISNSLVDRITLPDGSYYQLSYEPTPGVSGKVTGRIASVRLPTGGTISYTYQGGDTGKGILCADGSTAGFDRTTPDGTWQYRRTGTSPAFTTTITSPPDPKTGQNNQTVINFQGEFETQRQIYQGAASGTPLETIITCYNGNTVNCTTTAVATPFTQITTFRQFNGGQQARSDTLLNGYGLPTEKDEYDFGASMPTRKTTITYASLTNGIFDHPASVVVTDGAGNLQAKTTYAYDGSAVTATSGTPNHVNVTGARGNLTTVTTYSSATATLVRTFKYYDTGTVYQSQDINGQWTTYTYGNCGNSFLTTVSMPLSLSRSAAWNCTGGVMTSSTDENGKISYVNYTTDPYFWRPESVKDPLLNITNLSYPSLVQTERYLNFNGTTSTVDAVASLDSLGRTQYAQQKQAPGSSTYDSVRQTYDSFGRPKTASVPYAGAKASPPSGGAVTTTYYDALSRPIQVVDGGGGTVNITYNQNDVYTEAAPAPSVPPAPAAENTKSRQSQYDGLGRLRSVCEVTSEATYSGACGQTIPKTGYLTTYVYDISPSFNSLTVTQNAQRGTAQTRKYIYDMLHRLTSEQNPETSNLSYTYVYDTDATCGTSQGDLVKRVDVKGNVTCYAYDALHRLLSVTYPSGPNSASTAKKYFVYDSATVNGQAMANAKARLAEAYTCTTCPGTKITDLGFTYSARGEVTDVYESTPHSSGYYHLTASYFAHGALNALSGVPGLPTIYYGGNNDASGLDGEGRYLKVTTSSGTNLVSGVMYTTSGTTQPIGSLTQVTLGSGDNDTFGYDINTGRLTQYKFNIGATPQTVQGDLTWNANGTLAKLAITDPFNSADAQTCTFGYDDLARVKSANCGTPWNQTFSLDPFGNITKGGTLSFSPGYDQTKNWFTSLPGLSYDSNGNLQNDSFHTYTWDAENRLTAVDTVGLTFDALGRMVEQARGSSYTEIVYAPTGGKLALMNGQTLQKAFCPLPGGGTAVYTSSGLAYYRHSDWLGSSRFASTPSRTKYFDVAYGPYGEDYADSGTTDLNFTGQNQDTVSGMYDFMYREYHANSGRWIQPDPAGFGAASPANPQTWNRYAYVGNIPLTAVDPLGLFTHWSDVFGTARMGGIDPLRDPGGAWLAAQLQQFMADAGLLSPMQQGFGTYLGSIYGSGKVRFNDGGWQAYIPYPDWTSDNGFTIHTGNGRWVSIPGMPTAASNDNFSSYGPDPVAVANSMRQYVKNSLIIAPLQYLKQKVVWYFCGNSPEGAIENWMETGATKGAIGGAIAGAGAMGVETFGFGGVPGAMIGGHIGATAGAGGGVLYGSMAAGVCSAAGVYGH